LRTTRWVRCLKSDPRLNTAIRLRELGDFVAAVTTVSSKHMSIKWALQEKSVAIATKDQLRRLAEFSQNELIRRGMNQKTLRRIYSLTPVRPSKLAKCLKLLEQCEVERDSNAKSESGRNSPEVSGVAGDFGRKSRNPREQRRNHANPGSPIRSYVN